MNDLEQNIMEALAGNQRVKPDEISVEAFGSDVMPPFRLPGQHEPRPEAAATGLAERLSHQFTYPKVTEIRRVSLEIAGPPIRRGRARSQPISLRAPLAAISGRSGGRAGPICGQGLGGGQMAG
jgi:hypothetical protein